ncbi:MAG: HD domain-containing protein [Puniceicoccales bacterium]|jgi:tRNA nucleotidyltransferase (CCA-adding enzyme)|nr:HD domain-containing protein [Puniceicoccales bacterium]
MKTPALSFPPPAAVNPNLVAFASDALGEAVSGVVGDVAAAGGRALLVGGCVRDALLGARPKDVDIEVYGLEPGALKNVLRRRFEVISVGLSYGVFKLRGCEVDVSLPRRESKNGTGHRGFDVWGDPFMPLAEAASRRDFTVNAIYWDPRTGELLDPWNGRADLAAGVLRHTSAAFADDPLRVLRAMQFAARFLLVPAAETVELCRRIEPEGLPAERIFEEWSKLIVKGRKPSLGLAFLRDCGWVKYYPELDALTGVPQDPEWHPEGDVWNHTAHCLDAYAAARVGDVWEDTVVGFAVLCHDFGKAVTTRREESDGRIHAYGHEAAGVPLARSFLERMTRHRDLIESVLPLVEFHMRPHELWRTNASDAAIRRLARKVGRIDRLVRVDAADRGGRPPLVSDSPTHGPWLLERAAALALKDAAPRPILKGRHLIALGLAPGRGFSAILKAGFEAQLDGAFADAAGAVAWARERLGEQG